MVKILIIEDEQNIREEVAMWLDFEGYEVVQAENGVVGLNKALEHIPDLIVSDIRMPEGDGYSVLLEVRSHPYLKPIPFIFLTASSDHESIRHGMNLGADDYLTKPFNRMELLDAIKSRLDKQAHQQEAFQAQLESIHQVLGAERQQRLLKSRLVAMFSHDFRNPLTAIKSSAQLIRNYGDRMEADSKQKHLDRIEGCVTQLTHMIDDMLTIAEIENKHLEATPEIVDIAVFVEGVVDELRIAHIETHPIIFESNTGKKLSIDPKLLRQIVANLITNAVKYSPVHSEVLVQLMSIPEGVRLVVTDYGIGIPEEELPYLFDPFYRAENANGRQGTGLGLTIVKEAVDLCGGQVYVATEIGHGSIFTVDLH